MLFMARRLSKMAKKTVITTTTTTTTCKCTNSLTVVGKFWICLAIVMLALVQWLEAGPAPESAPIPATASDTMLVYAPPQKRGKFSEHRPKY